MKKNLVLLLCGSMLLFSACGTKEIVETNIKEEINELCVVNLEDCFVITDSGVVVTGRVESGTIRVGDKVIIKQQDGEIETEVTGLEMFRKTLDEAKEGDNIGVIISHPDRLTISPGDTLIVLEND